jgi:hypothetical protein
VSDPHASPGSTGSSRPLWPPAAAAQTHCQASPQPPHVQRAIFDHLRIAVSTGAANPLHLVNASGRSMPSGGAALVACLTCDGVQEGRVRCFQRCAVAQFRDGHIAQAVDQHERHPAAWRHAVSVKVKAWQLDRSRTNPAPQHDLCDTISKTSTAIDRDTGLGRS